MWFKNLQLYRFTKPFELDAETLGQQLEQNSFAPCRSQESSRSGWVSPLGRHGSELVHSANGYLMICTRRQDKLLPAAVINEALEEKVVEIEERETRSLPRKERRSLREEITFSLLPRALARSTLQYAYISPRDNLLVIDTSSAKRAEEVLDDLREALGSLSVIPLTSRSQPIDVMTRWVNSGQAGNGFTLGEECELRDNNDVSCLIRCKNQDLSTTEIVNHLKTGMHVSKLALSWKERIECVVDENLVLRRLRFSDLIHEQANDIEAEDVATRFDTDFSIMTLELSAFIAALIEAYGGEDSE